MSESLDQEIRTLQSLYWSERDPEGLTFAPLADAYLRQGKVKEALDLLTDGIARHPEYATGHVVATRLYSGKGMQSEAEFSARRALELDAENIVALSSLAMVLDDRGEIEEASQLRSFLVRLDPGAEEAKGFAELESDPTDAESVGFEDSDFGLAAVVEGSDDLVAGMEIDASAEPEPEVELMDLGALAPDAEPEPEVELMDLGALAPDAEPEPEVELMDLGALAPDPVDEVDELESEEPVYTRTLAEVYLKQGFVDQALHVLRNLLERDPSASDIARRIEEVRSGMLGGSARASDGKPLVAESGDARTKGEEEVEALARDLAESGADAHDVDTPFAWAEDEAPAEASEVDDGHAIGDYFDNLFAWESREES